MKQAPISEVHSGLYSPRARMPPLPLTGARCSCHFCTCQTFGVRREIMLQFLPFICAAVNHRLTSPSHVTPAPPRPACPYVCVKSCAHHTGWRLQPVAQFIRACKPSTHVLTPPYIGAPREVALDNIVQFSQNVQ